MIFSSFLKIPHGGTYSSLNGTDMKDVRIELFIAHNDAMYVQPCSSTYPTGDTTYCVWEVSCPTLDFFAGSSFSVP